MLDVIQKRLDSMTPAEKEKLRRIVTGEASRDLILRSAVERALREAKVGSVSLPQNERVAVQRALGAVGKAVQDIQGAPSHER